MADPIICFSATEVAKTTGLSLSTVRKLTREGNIPHFKVGRRILYPAEALAEWLTQQTVGGNAPEKDGAANG